MFKGKVHSLQKNDVIACQIVILKLNQKMSLQGNSPKPRHSVNSSRFQDDLADLELPERSILKQPIKPRESQPSLKQTQNQEIDEEFYNLELLPDSHIVSKHNATATTSSTFVSQKTDSKNQPKNEGQPVEAAVLRTSKKQSPNKKAVVTFDNSVQKNKKHVYKIKNNNDQQSFNDNNEVSWVLQNDEQMEIRIKIEQKIKNGYNMEKQGGGLKAKAQQLRKYNQLRRRVVIPISQTSLMSTEHNTVHNQPAQQARSKPQSKLENLKIQKQNDNNEDNVFKKSTPKIQQSNTKSRQLAYQSVINYYQRQFKFNQSDINDELIGRSKKIIQEEQQESKGFFSICACFKSSKRQQISNYNIPLAKRLVAISRAQLTNSEQQQFLLRQIWRRLTSKPFARIGSHWAQLGFQGKDPFTDLRSTGILSLLQWLQFIEIHPQLAQRYYLWCMGHYYPLALTFIRITDIFLDLLSKGMIKSENWDEFQRCFNCLVLGMFQRLMEKYKLEELVPNFIQNQANEIKKQFKGLLSSYNQQFKKIR